jgi:hypothetical protein
LLGRQVSALLFHPIACMQPAMARSFIGFFWIAWCEDKFNCDYRDNVVSRLLLFPSAYADLLYIYIYTLSSKVYQLHCSRRLS